MDYLKLQPKSIQNMNIRKNLIIFTITKIPPSNLPNKSKKEFLLNPKMKNYKLHQAFQKLSTMKRFCRSPNLIKILPTFQRLLLSHDYLRCQIKTKPNQKTKVQIISSYFQKQCQNQLEPNQMNKRHIIPSKLQIKTFFNLYFIQYPPIYSPPPPPSQHTHTQKSIYHECLFMQ